MKTINFEEVGIKIPTIKEWEKNEEPIALAKLTNGFWNWYIIAGDKLPNGDLYCFGYVEGNCDEFGFFLLSEILDAGAMLGLTFKPKKISLY